MGVPFTQSHADSASSQLPDVGTTDTDRYPHEFSVSSQHILDVGPTDTDRDPHELPTFNVGNFVNPASTILYLPPLLSSLPHELGIISDTPQERPPMLTETHLPDIDPVSLSLHKALHHFRPATPDYAGATYEEAFNWSELELPEDEEREWYCVVFRSKRLPRSDSEALYEADRQAHEEAVLSGGLLMYWYGVPNPETGMNLATCVWQSRKHAIAASRHPHHIRAMQLAAVSYEVYTLERHKLQKSRGQRGVTIEPFNGAEVGW